MSKSDNRSAWVIGIAATVMSAVALGVSSSISVFLVPIVTELGISMGQGSLTFSALSAGGIILALLVGRIVKRVPMKILVTIGGLMLFQYPFVISIATSIVPLYISAFIFGVGTILCGLNMSQIIVAQWFIKARSALMSAGSLSLALMVTVLFPTLASLIKTYGYRQVARMEGIIAGAIVIVIALVFLKDSPEKYGMHPYGYDPNSAEGSIGAKGSNILEGLPLKNILKTPQFWAIMICIIFGVIASRGYGSNNMSYFQSIGLDSVTAAFVISGAALVAMVVQLLYGIFAEKLGPRIIAFVFGCLCSIAFLLAFLWQGLSLAMVAMVLFGCAAPITSLLGPTYFPILFGRKEAGNIIGYAHVAASVGAMIGPFIAGSLFDKLGNYTIAFEILGVLLVIGLILMMISTNKKSLAKLNEERKKCADIDLQNFNNAQKMQNSAST